MTDELRGQLANPVLSVHRLLHRSSH